MHRYQFLLCASVAWVACGGDGDAADSVSLDASQVMPDAAIDGGVDSVDGGASDSRMGGWITEPIKSGNPAQFRLSRGRLYWLEADGFVITTLVAEDIEGSGHHAEIAAPPGSIRLVVVGESVYVASASGDVWRWDEGGLARAGTVPGLLTDLATDGTDLFAVTLEAIWKIGTGLVNEIVQVAGRQNAVGANDGVYWVDKIGNVVRWEGGRTAIQFTSPGPVLTGLAKFENHTFCAFFDKLYDVEMGAPASLLASIVSSGPIWATATHVYWLDGRMDYGVMRVTRSSGLSEQVVRFAAGVGLIPWAEPWQGGVIVAADGNFLWIHEM